MKKAKIHVKKRSTLKSPRVVLISLLICSFFIIMNKSSFAQMRIVEHKQKLSDKDRKETNGLKNNNYRNRKIVYGALPDSARFVSDNIQRIDKRYRKFISENVAVLKNLQKDSLSTQNTISLNRWSKN